MRTMLTMTTAVLALAACQKPTAAGAPLTTAQAEAIAKQTDADFAAGDLNRIMSHYADRAVVFDAGHSLPSTDRNVQAGWARAFASMKPGAITVSNAAIQLLDNDNFIASGIGSFTVAAGTARPTVSTRFTDVYQRQRDGSFRIVHEHMSMPPSSAPAP